MAEEQEEKEERLLHTKRQEGAYVEYRRDNGTPSKSSCPGFRLATRQVTKTYREEGESERDLKWIVKEGETSTSCGPNVTGSTTAIVHPIKTDRPIGPKVSGDTAHEKMLNITKANK